MARCPICDQPSREPPAHPTLCPNCERRIEPKYCGYCKRVTARRETDAGTDGKGTGRKLVCIRCGSSRLGEIQGFDAALM